MITRLLALLACLLPLQPALGEPHRYALDPIHTRIVFFVQHAGFSRAIGTFSGVTGSLLFDPVAPGSARVDATVPIARLDLGDAKWRVKVLDPTFFNVKKFSEARFASTSVEAVDPQRLRVSGELTLHGVKHPVVLDVHLNQIKRHPLSLRTTAGFSARTTLSRSAFDMEKWKKLVGDEVEVMIEVEAVRERNDKEKD